MAKTTARRENPVANEPFVMGKPLKAIDIHFFDDWVAKITFLKNVPVTDPNTGEIIRFDKKTPYEFVKWVPRGTSLEKISFKTVKIVEISD